MIPDVEQYLAHHSASEINSCAVGLGENLSAPAAHIDSALRIWKCAGCCQCYCMRRSRRVCSQQVNSQRWILDLREHGGMSGYLMVFWPEITPGTSFEVVWLQSTNKHKSLTFIHNSEIAEVH